MPRRQRPGNGPLRLLLIVLLVLLTLNTTTVAATELMELDKLDLGPVRGLVREYGSKQEKEEFAMFEDKVRLNGRTGGRKGKEGGEGGVGREDVTGLQWHSRRCQMSFPNRNRSSHPLPSFLPSLPPLHPQVAVLPPDAGGLTHFGNMALRVLQRHMHTLSRKPQANSKQDEGGREDEVLPALGVAVTLFDHAIGLSRHSGALSSKGVLWKLYPSLMESLPKSSVDENLKWERERKRRKRRRKEGGKEEGEEEAGGGSKGYEYLCRARESFVDLLSHHHQRQCASLSLVSPQGAVQQKKTRRGEEEEEEEEEYESASSSLFKGQRLLWSGIDDAMPLSLQPYSPTSTSSSSSLSSSSSSSTLPLTYFLYLTRLPNAYVQGPDGAIHDLYRSPPSSPSSLPPSCHIYNPSAGCYLSLECQFTYPDHSTGLSEAASLLTAFSGGGFFYHWLLDSLPRLLLLREALLLEDEEGGEEGGREERWRKRNVTLIVPPSPSRAHYVQEGLRLVAEAFAAEEEGEEEEGLEEGVGKGESSRRRGGSGRNKERIAPWPFNPRPLHYNGSGVLAVQTLYFYDWSPSIPPSSSPSTVPPHIRLCPPPSGLRLLRSTLVPSFPLPSARRYLVWLHRDAGQPRSVGNEAELLRALTHLARKELHTDLRILRGSQDGISGALALLPHARVVLGVHGANLANAVFCAEGTRLVELVMTESEFREYEHLASAVGLVYRPLAGQVPANGFDDVVWVDVPAVVAAARAAWFEGRGEDIGEEREENDEL